MRVYRFLRRYNQIALAIALTALILIISIAAVREWWPERQFDYKQDDGPDFDTPVIDAKVFETELGPVHLYSKSSPFEEAAHDLTFIRTRDGKQQMLFPDAKANVFRIEKIAGHGVIALAQTGEAGGGILANLIFVRFPDLERFVLETGVTTMDLGEIPREGPFTLVLFKQGEKGELVWVDPAEGAIVDRKPIAFGGFSPDAAPENKFQ